MAIKVEADAGYFAKRPRERDLALRLEESFDITSARELHGFSSWFARPNTTTSERFGFDREVLVIYSPHRTTDARVITAVDYLLRDPEFRHRLDKTVSLLIHNGDQSQTQKLVSSDIDRIIVPIHQDELRESNRGSMFIRSRIASAIGQIDLFGMSSPIISDQYFFGRNDLVQELQRRAISRQQNTGLFGLRRTGKTSVLRAVERRLEDQPVTVGYVDCSNPGIHMARWWQVLEEIARRLVSKVANRSGVRLVPPGSYEQATAGTRFLDDVKQVIDRSGKSRVLVMLDEIEYITSGLNKGLGRHWDDDYVPFWQVIRSTHQETLNNLVFIVAGVNPVCVNQSHFGGLTNPIFELANLEFLEPFDRHQVREMIRSIGKYSGIEFEEDVFAYLQDTYGGHPFLIRVACSEVWRTLDTVNAHQRVKVGVRQFLAIKDDIRSRLAQPIKDVLLSLLWWYPDEYDILQILATGASDFVEEYIRVHPGSIIQFGRYGILKKGNQGEFAIRDMRDFLILHGESYRKEVSPFRSSDIPAEILPEVPDMEQLTALFKMRSEVEIRLRRTIMVCLQVKYAFDPGKVSEAMANAIRPRSGERRDPRMMFVGRTPHDVMNDLYTLDLKDIIAAHWETFHPLFKCNLDEFERSMNVINSARRVDAHAKPFSQQEAELFKNSYGWLLKCVERVQ